MKMSGGKMPAITILATAAAILVVMVTPTQGKASPLLLFP